MRVQRSFLARILFPPPHVLRGRAGLGVVFVTSQECALDPCGLSLLGRLCRPAAQEVKITFMQARTPKANHRSAYAIATKKNNSLEFLGVLACLAVQLSSTPKMAVKATMNAECR